MFQLQNSQYILILNEIQLQEKSTFLKKNPYLNPFVISLKINHIVHGFPWWSSPTSKANIVHNSRSFYLKGEGKKLF